MNKSGTIWLVILLSLLLIAVSAFRGYGWHLSQKEELEAEITSLKDQLETEKTDKSSLPSPMVSPSPKATASASPENKVASTSAELEEILENWRPGGATDSAQEDDL